VVATLGRSPVPLSLVSVMTGKQIHDRNGCGEEGVCPEVWNERLRSTPVSNQAHGHGSQRKGHIDQMPVPDEARQHKAIRAEIVDKHIEERDQSDSAEHSDGHPPDQAVGVDGPASEVRGVCEQPDNKQQCAYR
jgi:hypothetical protein